MQILRLIKVHFAYYLGKSFLPFKRKHHAHLQLYNGRWSNRIEETSIDLQLTIHLKEHLVLGKGTVCHTPTGANYSVKVHGVTQISTISIILFKELPEGKEKLGIAHLNYIGKALKWNLIHKEEAKRLPITMVLKKV